MSTKTRRDLARLLMPTWRGLMEIEQDRCAEHGLTHWHYIVLADVQEHPDTSQKDLARRIFRSPSRLAADVEDLWSRGLVRRGSADHDRRVHRLALTDHGEMLTWRVRRLIHADEDRLLSRLDASERAQLRGLLERVLDPTAL